MAGPDPAELRSGYWSGMFQHSSGDTPSFVGLDNTDFNGGPRINERQPFVIYRLDVLDPDGVKPTCEIVELTSNGNVALIPRWKMTGSPPQFRDDALGITFVPSDPDRYWLALRLTWSGGGRAQFGLNIIYTVGVVPP